MIFGIDIRSLIELVMIYSLFGLSEFVVLRAGVFSVATPAFIAIGAYVSSGLTVKEGFPIYLGVLMGIVGSSLAGLLAGLVLSRLRGVYQAIATLGIVMLVDYAAQGWTSFTGGTLGLSGITRWATFWPILVFFAFSLLSVRMVYGSRLGDRITAVRDDEMAAASMGIRVARYQLVSFIASGILGGLAGAIYAANQYDIIPGDFSFSLVLACLGFVVVGGLSSMIGPVVGSFILTTIPLLVAALSQYGGAISGASVVLVLILLPQGIVPTLAQLFKSKWQVISISRSLDPPLGTKNEN